LPLTWIIVPEAAGSDAVGLVEGRPEVVASGLATDVPRLGVAGAPAVVTPAEHAARDKAAAQVVRAIAAQRYGFISLLWWKFTWPLRWPSG
jgi:hypothetical protein